MLSQQRGIMSAIVEGSAYVRSAVVSGWVSVFALAFGLAACEPSAEPLPAEPPVCDALESGRYKARGPGFGMPMSVTVTFYQEICEFRLTEWDMYHAVEAKGGVIDGRTVQLLGSDYWESCVGELAEDGRGAIGECADSIRPDGNEFELQWLPDENP